MSSRFSNKNKETNLNKSLKTTFDYNSNENIRNQEADNNYMIVKDLESKSTYNENTVKNSWNERVKKLSK